jgi:hypothetical protein
MDAADHKLARAVIKQIDAHCDIVNVALEKGNLGAVRETTEKLRELARRLEEWFIILGLEV